MSNLGVDLLRSDTGHYMQWPPAEDIRPAAPADPVRGRDDRAEQRGRTWIATLTANATARAEAPAAGEATTVWAAPRRAGRQGTALVLVNWLFLLLMLCTFLLAETLPTAGSALTGGTAGCTRATAVCATGHAGR